MSRVSLTLVLTLTLSSLILLGGCGDDEVTCGKKPTNKICLLKSDCIPDVLGSIHQPVCQAGAWTCLGGRELVDDCDSNCSRPHCGQAHDMGFPDSTADAGPADTGNDFYLTPYACGDTKTCYPNQYCQRTTPGVCGGTPMTDAGVCPPNCSPGGCPGGANDCTCQTYECLALPSSCFSCSCITLPGGCTCSDSKSGEIHVSCSMP